MRFNLNLYDKKKKLFSIYNYEEYSYTLFISAIKLFNIKTNCYLNYE